MKEEIEGIVIEIVDNIAKVKINRHGDCKNCGACPGDNALVLDVQNSIGAKVGQKVIFYGKEENMLKAAFIVYIMPLISIAFGVFLGSYFAVKNNQSEKVFEIGGAILGLALSIILIKIYDRSATKNRNIPVINRII